MPCTFTPIPNTNRVRCTRCKGVSLADRLPTGECPAANKPEPPVPRGPCQHLGPELRREACPTCNGGGTKIKVFQCYVHGECALGKKLNGVACCAGCKDYSGDPTDDREATAGADPGRVAGPRRSVRRRRRGDKADVGDEELPVGGPVASGGTLSEVDAIRVRERLGFQEVYCISLDRRPDRWEAFCRDFPADWPFAFPQRYSAVDGKVERPPKWWKQGGGAWGCYQSHLRIISSCVERGVESVMIFEDDAVIAPDGLSKLAKFIADLPPSAGMIYLGGQLLMAKRRPPTFVSEHWMRPFNVNRTHAYALRGETTKRILRHLENQDEWKQRHHVDHHYGRYHQRLTDEVVVPSEWIFGQREGKSNINGKLFERRFWPQPGGGLPTLFPPVFVIGLHSSGSSALAGVLHRLGVYMGKNFRGAHDGGHEDNRLARLCESVLPFPRTKIRGLDRTIRQRLLAWYRSTEAERPSNEFTRSGGKYPHLCVLGRLLPPGQLVSIDRPLSESIASLQRRCPKRDPEQLRLHQEYLWEAKQRLFETRPPALSVTYEELVEDPAGVIASLSAVLRLSPTEKQLESALAYVRPEKCHSAMYK